MKDQYDKKSIDREYLPNGYSDNELFSAGYYLIEFLRNGNKYGDADMLLLSIPESKQNIVRRMFLEQQ